MLGIVVFFAFIVSGVIQGAALFRRRDGIVQVWLGSVIGLVEMMWLPSLFAYRFDFTLKAQNAALIASGVLAVLALMALAVQARRGLPERNMKRQRVPVKMCLLLVLPMALLAGYLQYTHNFRMENGAYYVGQSTYGDLCMHAGFATGLIGQSYPPEYTILPGTKLGYPFLVDALSSTMLIYGTSLAGAFVIPGTVMTALIYLGFAIYAWDMTKRKSALWLAFLLFALNGGLGFLEFCGIGDIEGLKNALTGFYQAPTNMPAENLQWRNALSDLIIPQRTLMAGWVCLIPALYLLNDGIRTRKTAVFAFLGVFAGTMPMIHTHSFLGLGTVSLGAMIVCLFRDRGHRLRALLNFGIYGSVACLIAFPQLLEWTFPQTVDGGSLRIVFNWVNNRKAMGAGLEGLIDGYFWFWIRNVGLIYILFFLAGIMTKKLRVKAMAFGALLLYVLSEFVLFQPNVFDNIKLFFVCFIALLPSACELAVRIYKGIENLRVRRAIAAAFIVLSVASGTITIVRECISNEQIFGSGAVKAAAHIKENTPADSLFLTSTTHTNAPNVLAGRKIVCGASLYVHFHGLDYLQRETDAVLMLAYPEKYSHLYEEYGVDYVYVSSYERNRMYANKDYVKLRDPADVRDSYFTDEGAIAGMYPMVYEGGEWYDIIRIYAVSERAQQLYAEGHENIIEG